MVRGCQKISMTFIGLCLMGMVLNGCSNTQNLSQEQSKNNMIGKQLGYPEGTNLSAEISPTPAASTQSTGLNWHKIYDTNEITSFAFGNEVYVAVGDNGIIKTSATGEAWKIADTDQYFMLNSIVYGASKFVAVGRNIVVSSDGKAWKEASFKRGDSYELNFKSVTWNGSVFVAVGVQGLIASSPDGISWTDHSLKNGYNCNFNAIVTNGSKFIASNDTNTLYESDNGVDWYTNQPSTEYSNYKNIACNGDVFLICLTRTAVLVSKDGISWTSHPQSFNVLSITAQGKKFVAAGGDAVGYTMNFKTYTSEDGINWKTFDLASDGDNYYPTIIYWVGDKFIKGRPNGKIFTSADAVNWTPTNINAENPFTDIEWTGTTLTLSADTLAKYHKTPAVASNGNVYIKVGGKRAGYTGDGAFDSHWSTISTSTDEVNWSDRITENGPYLNKVVWGNDRFIAVGDNGTMLTSPDGISEWTAVNTGSFDNLNDIIWDGTRFIAAGWTMLSSDDGISWVLDKSSSSNDNISQLLWNSEQYVGLGTKSIRIAPRPKQFADMENHWAKPYVLEMTARNIIKGVDQDHFAPDRDITRAEFAAIVVRALNLTANATGTAEFSDVEPSDWYYESIAAAYEKGILSGYGDGVIKPENPITRQEAMAMTARAMALLNIDINVSESETTNVLSAFNDDADVEAWARQNVAACIKNDIVQGSNGSLKPENNIIRAETATIISKVLAKAGL